MPQYKDDQKDERIYHIFFYCTWHMGLEYFTLRRKPKKKLHHVVSSNFCKETFSPKRFNASLRQYEM